MLKKRIVRLLSLVLVLCFVFPTPAIAATGDPQTIQYLYFQNSSAQMVIVDYVKAINDAISGNLILYNSIKENLGTAILSGAPVYLETTIGSVLDYQKAITDNKPDLIQIQDDPLYQASKPSYSQELTVVGGVAVIVPITIPSAPAVTNDDTANTVSGMIVGYEYSIDGMPYVLYDAMLFSAIDFSGNHTLQVRVAAAGSIPAGAITTLLFTTNLVTPPAPIVTNNDTLNTVIGMTTAMEYNLDGAGYVAYDATTFSGINLNGEHTLLVRYAADLLNGFTASYDTTLTFTSSTIENAEVAVSVYESALIGSLAQITSAEALKVPAEIAVALVTDAPAKAAFESRIVARTAQIAAAKANFLGNEALNQAIAEVAVANLEAAPLANIANINTATGLKNTADAKVLLVGDSIAKAAFQQRITTKFIAMAIVELDQQTFAPSYESYMAKYVTVLGIDFTDYNALADKMPVHNAMVAATFTTINEIQTTFNNAVALAKASETSIVTAFNSAVDAAAIGTAITTYAPSISLALTEYNAILDKTPVHTELLGRNFTSGDQVKTAIIIAIINNSSAVNIGNVLSTNATYLGLQTISEFSNIRNTMQNAVFASKPIADKTQLVVIAVSSSTQYYLGQMLPYFKDIMGLNLTDYNAMTYRSKVNVQNDIVALTLVTKTEVQIAYNTSVANRKVIEATALAMFNSATTAAEIGTAIISAVNTNFVMYDNADYAGLSNKVPVQSNLLIPTFESMIQVEAAIGTASSTQKLYEAAAMTNINNASTPLEMDAAIITNSPTLGWNLTDYNALSNKLSVQNTMLSQMFYSLSLMKTTFDTAVTTQKAVDAINNADATAMGALITSNSAVLGLTAASITDYNALAIIDKDSVHMALVGKAFIDKAAIKTAFEAAVGVPHINAVTTPAAMGLAINNYAASLGLSLASYNTLGPVNKTAVQNAMLTPVFLNALDIKTVFDAAVSIEKVNAAVAAMNSAPSTTFMASYITTYATTLGLDLTDYNSLSNKVPVQTAMLTPVFVTAADVKTVFDTAVAVAKVNEATFQTIGAVLTDNATILGLDLTDYTALLNKEPVHIAMLTPVFTTAATVKTDFDIAVAIQKAIEGPISETPSVVLNKSTTSLIIGTNETLTATVLPASAPNKAVIWSSDNDAVATVDSNGLVTGTGGGTAIITVTTVVGGYTDTCTVNVIVPVTGIVLNKTETSLLVGMADTLIASVLPASATNKELIWTVASSSNSATVNNGIVTGAAVGIATITVKTVDGNFNASCFVTVTTEASVLNNFNGATELYMPGIIIQYANVVGLDLTNYLALDPSYQSQVQRALISPTFTTLAEIKAVFDETMLLLTLNAATMDTMNSVITNNAIALGLDLAAYDLLSPANQKIVHGYLLVTMYNFGGFYTAADFQTTFDLAVTNAPAAEIALAEINAATADEISTVLVSNGNLLGLDLFDYTNYPDQVAMNTALAAQDFTNPYDLLIAIISILYA